MTSKSHRPQARQTPARRTILATAALAAFAALAGGAGAASAASLTRSVEVDATPDQVWAAIGPFCAIAEWLPPVGSCTMDMATPPTRTLVTRDGTATFVELQTARDDDGYSYSYTFLSSPLPVSDYISTIAVADNGRGGATVTWSATYDPAAGQETTAGDALGGIYDAGLDSIQSRFAQ